MNKPAESEPSSNEAVDLEEGYTVLELMMVVLILALLGRSAISMTVQTLDAADKSTAEVQVVQDLRQAQAAAVTEGCRGIFTIASAGTHYSFSCDYLPYDTAATPTGDTTMFTAWLPNGITLASSGLIIFNSRGQTVDTASALTTRTVTLTSSQTGSSVVFATGTLRATGFFSYN